MLSSDHKRFHWAKQDRAAEPTLFRELMGKWHSQVHHDRPMGGAKGPLRASAAQGEKPKAPASVWSPWLWVR